MSRYAIAAEGFRSRLARKMEHRLATEARNDDSGLPPIPSSIDSFLRCVAFAGLRLETNEVYFDGKEMRAISNNNDVMFSFENNCWIIEPNSPYSRNRTRVYMTHHDFFTYAKRF